MRVSISIKWTLSAIFIVVAVVFVYAFFMISDSQKSVDLETERIRRIQYEALDQLGEQTTRFVSMPSSSLMFDNDLEGLKALFSPIVDDNKQSAYGVVYATIVDTKNRVWVAVLNAQYDRLKLGTAPFFDRSRENLQFLRELDAEFTDKYRDETKLPITEDVERTVFTSSGEEQKINVRQYVVAIRGSGETQGYLLVGYSIDGLSKEINAIREQGEMRKQETVERSLLLAIIAILVGFFISGIQALIVTRNIKKLSKVADLIANGDFSVRTDVRSRDEIGQLGEQFNVMANKVQELMLETEQKAMLEKELDIARSIQTTLLPPGGYAKCGAVQLNGYFQPASVCGGDFWSYNKMSDGSTLLTIGDVTGHGVPSAMITACAKAALDTLLSLSSSLPIPLSRIIAEINVAICQTAKRSLFMTFQGILISPDGKRGEIANAGHNFPLLSQNGEIKALVARGDRLGDNIDAQYESVSFEIGPEDMLLMYTDGITEYLNPQGVEYGEKRLRRVLSDAADLDVNQGMRMFWEDFAQFCENAPQEDDITLMFIKV